MINELPFLPLLLPGTAAAGQGGQPHGLPPLLPLDGGGKMRQAPLLPLPLLELDRICTDIIEGLGQK